ncbi:LysR family transcriptional regulator [Paracoccus sp. p3-h83]|uniref:LysR family transcriptional regulator n=1 Tax=Paracoccus sp. p3-h83 TaxID=3342805 RepID=UPI0035B75252
MNRGITGLRTSTIIGASLALEQGGLRAAARVSGQPVATLGAALTVLETALGLTLVRRGPGGLALTVQAQGHSPAIARLAARCRDLQVGAARPVGLAALFRFAQVARSGSIRAAALQLGLAQPHLTRQIAQLEIALDRPLLIRDASGARPTPQGQSLIPAIEALEADWLALTAAARASAPPQARRHALGTIIPATPGGDLAALIGRIARDLALRQGDRLAITASPAEELLAGLDSGKFDAVIVDAPAPGAAYRQHLLARGALAMVGRALPATATDRDGLRAALIAQPLALQTRHSGLRQRAEAFLDAHAGPDWRDLTRVIEVDSLPVIVRLARDGDVCSVLPGHPSLQLPPAMQLALPGDYDQSIWLTWLTRPKAGALAARIVALAG